MFFPINLAVLLLFFSFSSLCKADIALTFGLYTSDKPTSMVRIFRPILNELERAMEIQLQEKVKIQISVAKSYDEGISDLTTGKVDFSRMGPASYILSKEKNPGIRLIVMEEKKGKTHFWGIIFVNNDTNIDNISQLKMRSFAFGNKNSTIGRYLSQNLLVKNGIQAHQLLSFSYLSRHDRVATAVGNKQFDAGAIKESTFIKMKRNGTPIREIARFPNVTKPWISNSTMDQRLFLTLQKSLLTFNKNILVDSLKKSGFTLSSDRKYDTIRKAMRNNHQFFDKKYVLELTSQTSHH